MLFIRVLGQLQYLLRFPRVYTPFAGTTFWRVVEEEPLDAIVDGNADIVCYCLVDSTGLFIGSVAWTATMGLKGQLGLLGTENW